ncbi:unnamed protein product [Brassica oleracea]
MGSQTGFDHQSVRTFKMLQPSQWDDYLLYAQIDELELDVFASELEEIKPNVRDMLMSSSPAELGHGSAKRKVLLIYLMTSLGVAYHFEKEIEKTLAHAFEKIDDMIANEHELYTISILFWVFRTYGYNMSADAFKRFKGDDGMFMDSLAKDAKGMLSLYEAAHLRTTRDYIMDEALSFTMKHMESLAGQVRPHLSRLIQNALGLSQHWNMEILVAMEFISFYEQEEDHDETLLKFSKLNFKLLQLTYLKELKMVTKWYKELDFASKLPPYFRDRIVELHFFVISMYFEPQFSSARIMLTKFYTVETITDDTFDRYASISEAENLANSLERWAPDKDMDTQPDYLKFVFTFILDVFKDFEGEVGSEGRYYSVKGAIEEDDMSRGYVTTGVNCYMKQYGVTKGEAFKKLHQMRVHNEKIVNEEFLTIKDVPRRVLKEAINCARMTNVAYGYGEGLTHPEGKIKEYIISLYVELIRL